MRSAWAIALVTACGSQKPVPVPVPVPVPASASASAPSTASAIPKGECPVEAIAARIAAEWGTPDAPKVWFAGQVAVVSKRVEAHDKQRRAWVDELRPHANGPLACAAAAHVQIGIVDDTFRSAVLHAKLDTIPPESEAKIAEVESKAKKVLSDPKSTPDEKERARQMLAQMKQVRDNTTDMGKTALRGWSAYATIELIDSYARAVIEARKAGLKNATFASAWKRMGAIVVEVGEDEVNERLTQAKKDHPDVPVDAKLFMSPCSWPAGC